MASTTDYIMDFKKEEKPEGSARVKIGTYKVRIGKTEDSARIHRERWSISPPNDPRGTVQEEENHGELVDVSEGVSPLPRVARSVR